MDHPVDQVALRDRVGRSRAELDALERSFLSSVFLRTRKIVLEIVFLFCPLPRVSDHAKAKEIREGGTRHMPASIGASR
jgi:hypothetical protein